MKTSPALKKIRIFWGRHVAAWRRSSLTQAAYSREHELSLKSLSYWIRRKHSFYGIRTGSGSSISDLSGRDSGGRVLNKKSWNWEFGS